MSHTKTVAIFSLLYFWNCTNDPDNDENIKISDITNIYLTNRSPNCEDYAGEYFSIVNDINNNSSFVGELLISSNNQKCTFSSNSITNHYSNNVREKNFNTI